MEFHHLIGLEGRSWTWRAAGLTQMMEFCCQPLTNSRTKKQQLLCFVSLVLCVHFSLKGKFDFNDLLSSSSLPVLSFRLSSRCL